MEVHDVIITEKAAEKAKMILAQEGKDNWGLRIYSAGGGCCGPSYGLDIDETPSPEDDVIEQNGLKVFVGRDLSGSLQEMQLDYIQDGFHEGFILSGGNAPSCSSSGCGSASGCSSCE